MTWSSVSLSMPFEECEGFDACVIGCFNELKIMKNVENVLVINIDIT